MQGQRSDNGIAVAAATRNWAIGDLAIATRLVAVWGLEQHPFQGRNEFRASALFELIQIELLPSDGGQLFNAFKAKQRPIRRAGFK